MNNRDLALFDFDGTITTKDTFLYFLKYTHPNVRLLWNLFLTSPYLIAFLLGGISNEAAKTKLFSAFYKGVSCEQFDRWAKGFLSHINSYIKPNALQRIRWHQERGDRVIVISAGFDRILKYWCEQENIELLSTQVGVENEKITGKFGGPNCFGIEKVNRVKAHLDLADYKNIYAYGDSSGDLEMMKIATFPTHSKQIFT